MQRKKTSRPGPFSDDTLKNTLNFLSFQRLIRFWSNFVKYGDPNGAHGSGGGPKGASPGSENPPVWPVYAAPHWSHLAVNDRDLKVQYQTPFYTLSLSIGTRNFYTIILYISVTGEKSCKIV